MLDFDALVNGPVEQTFGGAWTYLPQGAPTALPITATFFEGYLSLEDGLPPHAQGVRPMLGLQVSQLTAAGVIGYDAEAAQGDLVTHPDGRVFVVKSGQPDGTGWAKLELALAP